MAARWILLAALCLLVASVIDVEARSNGAPPAACGTMTPSHGFGASPNPGGYTVTPSTTSYTLGQTYTMTVTGQNQFKGFFCQTRQGSTQTSAFIGPFPSGSQQRAAGSCTNAVTHTSAVLKSSMTFNWRVDSATVGTFKFVCTVVQSYSTFYVMVPSADVSMAPLPTTAAPTTPAPTTPAPATPAPATPAPATPAPATPAPATPAPTVAGMPTTTMAPATPAPTTMAPMPTTAAPTTAAPTTAAPTSITATGCGTTKSCYRTPSTCTGSTDCSFFYSQRPVGTDRIQIELVAKADNWVAIGYSNDTKMGDDDVMGCAVDPDGTTIHIKNTHNQAQGKLNVIDSTIDPTAFLGDMQSSYTNGQLACTFTRPRSTGSATDRDLGSSNKYYLFFGTNTLASARSGRTASLPYHSSTPLASSMQHSPLDITVQDLALGSPAAIISTDGCGTTKSCFRNPSGCSWPADCTFLYTQTPVGTDRVEIAVAGKSDGWIAVGYSDDKTMGKDDVLGCNVASNGVDVFIKNTWNPAKYNILDNNSNPSSYLTDMRYTFSNGKLACRFTRPLTTGSVYDKDLASPNKYYIFFGMNVPTSGRGGASSSLIGRHNSIPDITGVQTSVTDRSIANIGTSATDGLIKAHGFVMIVAWVCLAGIGIFMPRFMKKAWMTPEDGVAWWFKLHRPLMATVWCLSIVGFILIVIFKKGVWSTTAGAHPAIGLTTFLLCMIQPFMAMIRKKLSSFQRKVFNWTHRTAGFCAHALGAISVYLGMDLFRKNYGLSNAALYTWAAWVALEGLFWIGLELKQTFMPPKNPQAKISSDAGIRKAILIVYSLTCIALGLTMAIMVVSAGSGED